MIGALMKPLPLTIAIGGAGMGTGEIENLGQGALDMVLTVKTQMEMRSLVQAMRIDYIFSKKLPRQRELQKYARDKIDSQGTDPALDGWGTPWQITKIAGDSFLLSCGPDKSCNTEDDIEQIIVNAKGRFQKVDWD